MDFENYWSRAIILVDMDAFFAAIEQKDFPEIKGKPIAVTNGKEGSTIITASYEARKYGIKTGHRFREAKKLCPRLLKRPSRPERYAEISRSIMVALKEEISPNIEIFSVDEAFLDVTDCQKNIATPAQLGEKVKTLVSEISGCSCSVGVAGDKTTAKYAASVNKPNGLTVIAPQDSKNFLKNVPVTKLCGINTGVANFLAKYGVRFCGDMEKIPIHILAKRFGNIGRRLWLMCQGLDPAPLQLKVNPPKSIGHGKVLPPNTKDLEIIKTYLLHMCEKVATRLRSNNMMAQIFFIGMKLQNWGWVGDKYKTIIMTNDGTAIYKLAKKMLLTNWHNQIVMQVQVTALSPVETVMQGDFFTAFDIPQTNRNSAIDLINQKYGKHTMIRARLLNQTKTPNVISPAWKPEGFRQSI